MGKKEDQCYSKEISWEIRTKANHRSLFWSRLRNDVYNNEKNQKLSNDEKKQAEKISVSVSEDTIATLK